MQSLAYYSSSFITSSIKWMTRSRPGHIDSYPKMKRDRISFTYIFSIFFIFKHMYAIIHNGQQYFLIMINAFPDLVQVKRKARKQLLLVMWKWSKLSFCSVHSFVHTGAKTEKVFYSNWQKEFSHQRQPRFKIVTLHNYFPVMLDTALIHYPLTFEGYQLRKFMFLLHEEYFSEQWTTTKW